MLFEPALPPGMRYEEGFLTVEQEAALLASIQDITFSTFEMHGVAARRRVSFYGQTYDEALPGADFPQFLLELRARMAPWAGVEPGAFVMALINEYPPGAPIGWHRDAPQYGIVAGLSLLSSCRMRLRPYVSPADLPARTGGARRATHELTLVPRSAYLLAGEARSRYEHSIPPVKDRRYSITFRTLRTQSRR
ncbi:MAG TPA: alpha-ketoglutarate-dependent dioxygenase AlkB [Vicinamibacterales bacterium]|nr:alpha-ketoglutarate-dependent dioxygenase AlkB [Vicinamibacterales bacterium]